MALSPQSTSTMVLPAQLFGAPWIVHTRNVSVAATSGVAQQSQEDTSLASPNSRSPLLPIIAALGAFIGVVFSLFEMYRRYKRRGLPDPALAPPRLAIIQATMDEMPINEPDAPSIWEVSCVGRSIEVKALSDLMPLTVQELRPKRPRRKYTHASDTSWSSREDSQDRERPLLVYSSFKNAVYKAQAHHPLERPASGLQVAVVIAMPHWHRKDRKQQPSNQSISEIAIGLLDTAFVK